MIDLRIGEAIRIAWRLKFLDGRAIAVLSGYFVLTAVSSGVDGMGLVMLVSLLSRSGGGGAGSLPPAISGVIDAFGFSPTYTLMLAVVCLLFSVRLGCMISLIWLDAKIAAVARCSLQHHLFSRVLRANWSDAGSLQLGRTAGVITEEANNCAVYYMGMVKAVYFLIAAMSVAIIAFSISIKLTFAAILVGLPFAIILAVILRIQSRLSIAQTEVRQDFASYVTERLAALFQIKIERSEQVHQGGSKQRQDNFMRLESIFGVTQAFITNFNLVVIVFVLWALLFWSVANPGNSPASLVPSLAALGMIGARAAAYLNNLVSSVGNLSRFGGSIERVKGILNLPAAETREGIDEDVVEIRIEGVNHSFGTRNVLKSVDFVVRRGIPVVLRGSSGSGKTTLANFVAGVTLPDSGRILYIGRSGRAYGSQAYALRIGYVTQDIHLLRGTVRSNLAPIDRSTTDQELWHALACAGADEFIRTLGGLDELIDEAAKNLSGGERRRLGIARALAMKPDIFIFDEVTNGLDASLKGSLLATIEGIAKDAAVIAISHLADEYKTWCTVDVGADP